MLVTTGVTTTHNAALAFPVPLTRILRPHITTSKVMRSNRPLQTILFTDIVGSTKRATELGHRDWNRLLNEHNARSRYEIRRFGGREIKALADGFMAAFSRPAQAIRCAWSVREALRELGLEVRRVSTPVK